MPSEKPRIALTVPDEVKAVYDYTAGQMGIPTSKLVLQVMEESLEQIKAIGEALEMVKKDPQKGLSIMDRMVRQTRIEAAGVQVDLEDAIAREKRSRKPPKAK